jgi:arylsulfatase A-like enzyme
MKQPNIVIFFTDDQRFDTIHALGNTDILTPNIDKLVKRGTAFTQAHIPCGTVGAVCMPSRAMLHTGRSLFHLEKDGEQIPSHHAMLGEQLKQRGYKTFGTGKWHNGTEAFNRSFDEGSEIFFGGMTDHWNVPAHDYDPECKYDGQIPRCKSPTNSNEVVSENASHINSGYHSSEMVCDAGIDFIQKQDEDTPFFAYISFLAPHDPRVMPERFKNMYKAEDIKLPPNFCGGHPFDTGAIHIRDEMLASFPRTPEETREHIADYYSMISHLDDELGRVTAALDDKGLAENTIIVFAGDNGLALGQHGLFGKQSCYEHSVRVPLIFAGPNIPENQKVNRYAYLFDVFPTLCELVGMEIPDSVDGSSLMPAIQHDTIVREGLYFAYGNFQRACKHDGYKLIEYCVPGKIPVTQLFNVDMDPWELNDLANGHSYSEKISMLRNKMFTFRDDWDDLASSLGRDFWSRYPH